MEFYNLIQADNFDVMTLSPLISQIKLVSIFYLLLQVFANIFLNRE